MAIWRGSGLNSMIFLAALQAIPREYYEAAAVDGAGRWRQLRDITLPSLRFAIFFVVATTLIAWLQFFEEPFVLTKGGPLDSTTSVSMFVYRAGFNLFQYGYASAGSMTLFVAIMGVTLIQFRARRADFKA
jgi:multiple sugar transport system permease protein